MPNHVRNILKIKTKNVHELLETIAEQNLDSVIFDYRIDFNKIVPEPRTKKECPIDCLIAKDSYVEEDKDRPWFDWYKWHNEYWGTKWNAYDCYSIIGKSYVIFVFSTAWSFPYPVMLKLAAMKYSFELKYADEAIGSNCGMLIHDLTTGRFDHYDEDEITHPEQFAKRVWKK